VIAASGPALKPFFFYLPTLIGSSSRDTHKGSTSQEKGESYDLQRFHTSTSISTGPRARYGERDSMGHMIDMEGGIIKTTDVSLTVEYIPELQGGGCGRRGSRAP